MTPVPIRPKCTTVISFQDLEKIRPQPCAAINSIQFWVRLVFLNCFFSNPISIHLYPHHLGRQQNSQIVSPNNPGLQKLQNFPKSILRGE